MIILLNAFIYEVCYRRRRDTEILIYGNFLKCVICEVCYRWRKDMDIKVDHVSKAYGEQQILRDLCCVFPEGKTTCIRGRSGCGKTTLIRLLLGLDIPDKGKIEGISDRKISAVFQEDRLCENLSAASNIRLVCTETIDYILKKTEGKTLIFVTHEEQEAVWLKADKTLKFMKDHLIK